MIQVKFLVTQPSDNLYRKEKKKKTHLESHNQD